jgi:hypothetical protein
MSMFFQEKIIILINYPQNKYAFILRTPHWPPARPAPPLKKRVPAHGGRNPFFLSCRKKQTTPHNDEIEIRRKFLLLTTTLVMLSNT